MNRDKYNYTSIIKEFYLRRAGSESNVSREHAFQQGLFEHEYALVPVGKHILDAGAGDGEFSRLLAERNDVVCVEVEPELVGMCCDKDMKCISADLNAPLPFRDNTFDVVFSRCVIEHLYNPWMFLSEAHRTLKRNGELIILTTNNAFVADRVDLMFFGNMSVDHDLKKWTPRTLSTEMRRNGFDVVSCNHTKMGWIEKIIPAYMFRSIIYRGIKTNIDRNAKT